MIGYEEMSRALDTHMEQIQGHRAGEWMERRGIVREDWIGFLQDMADNGLAQGAKEFGPELSSQWIAAMLATAAAFGWTLHEQQRPRRLSLWR
jgi:hypothetical protein